MRGPRQDEREPRLGCSLIYSRSVICQSVSWRVLRANEGERRSFLWPLTLDHLLRASDAIRSDGIDLNADATRRASSVRSFVRSFVRSRVLLARAYAYIRMYVRITFLCFLNRRAINSELVERAHRVASPTARSNSSLKHLR